MTEERGPSGPKNGAKTAEEKAADKAALEAQRLIDFKVARERLRKECAKRGNMSRFYPLFSPNWISDMCMPESVKPSTGTGPIQQDRLIWYYRNQLRLTLYDRLADLINHDTTDRTFILKRYQGLYRYFRFAAVGRDPAQYVSGAMRIEDEGGKPAFSQWSHGLNPEKDEPSHRGYVYRVESNLFFAGKAEGVMRLSIARTLRGRGGNDYMPGLVLSMRSGTRDPFAARFLMVLVEEKNEELLAQLDPANVGSRAKFDELAKANEEPHYMILDVKDRKRQSD